MTFSQRRNRLTTRVSGRIPVVKRRISVLALHPGAVKHMKQQNHPWVISNNFFIIGLRTKTLLTGGRREKFVFRNSGDAATDIFVAPLSVSTPPPPTSYDVRSCRMLRCEQASRAHRCRTFKIGLQFARASTVIPRLTKIIRSGITFVSRKLR